LTENAEEGVHFVVVGIGAGVKIEHDLVVVELDYVGGDLIVAVSEGQSMLVSEFDDEAAEGGHKQSVQLQK